MMSNNKNVLELILDELKSMRVELNELGKTVAKQEANLETHMKRSDQLEELVSLTKKELSIEIEPVKRHVDMVNGALKFIGVLGICVGILTGLVELLKLFF